MTALRLPACLRLDWQPAKVDLHKSFDLTSFEKDAEEPNKNVFANPMMRHRPIHPKTVVS